MTSREIITLQFGHGANFVGTHFWNIQESAFCFSDANKADPRDEIDHDVLFREGRNHLHQTTYTPRLLLFDLKGALQTLPESGGALYGESEGEVVWSNDVTLHKAPSPLKNEFLKEVEAENEEEDADRDRDETEVGLDGAAKESKAASSEDLEDDVIVWSDFLGTQLHPKSVTVVREFCHGVEAGIEGAFDHFLQGWDLFRSGSSHRETFEEDNLRFFAEECDYLQGFHLLSDSASGFAGVTAAALEHLHEEFPGRARLALPLFPTHLLTHGDNSRKRGAKLLSVVLAITESERHASALCPLGLSTCPWWAEPLPTAFPWLRYDPDRPYHSAAVLASGLDSLSLCYRTKAAPHSLGLLTSLADAGRNLLSLRTALPLPLIEGGSLFQLLQDTDPEHLFAPLSPLGAALTKEDPLLLSVRGVPPSRIKGANGNLQEVLLAFACEHMGPRTLAFSCGHRQPLKRPFPRIFDPRVAPSGDLRAELLPSADSDRVLPANVATAVTLQNARGAGEALEQLRVAAEAVPLAQCLPPSSADVMELDDMKEMVERFSEMCEAYLEEPLR